ncbi:MAG: DUF3099 domain-containing protein [Actinomycetota bacterium]|nr:DUF3099 domain-containing protein [Actinomycetota bacterium]
MTSAPQSAADEQAQRLRRYLATMAFRVLCTVLAIVASGWVRWTLVAAAVILPYIAVVMANAVRPRADDQIAPVGDEVQEVRALDRNAVDDTDRIIHGHVLDD